MILMINLIKGPFIPVKGLSLLWNDSLGRKTQGCPSHQFVTDIQYLFLASEPLSNNLLEVKLEPL